jgi:hypothetical protein
LKRYFKPKEMGVRFVEFLLKMVLLADLPSTWIMITPAVPKFQLAETATGV